MKSGIHIFFIFEEVFLKKSKIYMKMKSKTSIRSNMKNKKKRKNKMKNRTKRKREINKERKKAYLTEELCFKYLSMGLFLFQSDRKRKFICRNEYDVALNEFTRLAEHLPTLWERKRKGT